MNIHDTISGLSISGFNSKKERWEEGAFWVKYRMVRSALNPDFSNKFSEDILNSITKDLENFSWEEAEARLIAI